MQFLSFENYKNKMQIFLIGLASAGNKLWFLTFGYVEVEEVAVQNSLNDAGNYSDPILEALTIVTVDPV